MPRPTPAIRPKSLATPIASHQVSPIITNSLIQAFQFQEYFLSTSPGFGNCLRLFCIFLNVAAPFVSGSVFL